MNSVTSFDLLNKLNIFPCYQPIVDVCSAKVAGYECLARARDISGKITSAGWLFTDHKVDCETQLNLDFKVRNEALDCAACHPESGLIFINISPLQIESIRTDDSPTIIEYLQEINLDPSRVVLEITESFFDTKLLDRFVSVYRDAGVKIAIDDFGKGGSQIDRVVAYSPDYLKIDMEMFKNAAHKGKSSSAILSLADLADRSGCEILCEGVETEEEYHFALECGARKIQGWLFDKALEHPVDRFTYYDEVMDYQASYLNRKAQKIVDSFEAGERLSNHLNALVESYRKDDFSNLDVVKLYELGVIRVFECDFSGQQVSPNYMFSEDGMQVDFRCRGRNWAHRPYFSLLLALFHTVENRQIVSSIYVDQATKVLCKTRGLILSSSRVLFIDTATPEETLFCEQTV